MWITPNESEGRSQAMWTVTRVSRGKTEETTVMLSTCEAIAAMDNSTKFGLYIPRRARKLKG